MTAASAYSPHLPEPSDGRLAEPSMEDILASIRRIIADDQSQGVKSGAGASAPRRAPPQPVAEPDRPPASSRTPYDDVLDLARLVPAAERQPLRPAVDRGRPVPAQLSHGADETAEDDAGRQDEDISTHASGLRARLPEPEARASSRHDGYDHPVPAVAEDGGGDLLSAPMGASVMSAFETLAATVVLQNTPMLEGVMRDLLRPMLKNWLDDHLPSLVERLVRVEIERVARGGRG